MDSREGGGGWGQDIYSKPPEREILGIGALHPELASAGGAPRISARKGLARDGRQGTNAKRTYKAAARCSLQLC